MQREYFCTNCFVYCFEPYDPLYPKKVLCPNPLCDSYKTGEHQLYACDTTAFAYYFIANEEKIRDQQWTSVLYVPEKYVKLYERKGVRVEKGEVDELPTNQKD